MIGNFNVVVFYADETNEYVRRGVDAEEAAKAFQHYCNCVAVELGVVTRVMITNMLDECNADWQAKKGLVFPPKEELEEL